MRILIFLFFTIILIASNVKAESTVISVINDDLSATVRTENFTIGLKFTDTTYEIKEESTTPSPFIIKRKDNLIISTFIISSSLKEIIIKDITGDGLPNIRIINILDKSGKVLSTTKEGIIITYTDKVMTASSNQVINK